MSKTRTKEQLLELVGEELGTSRWFQVDQGRIDQFADVTEDHQYIHVDPERAKDAGFGGTIARWLSMTASTRSGSPRR
jgi:acyl dehydratase